MLLCNYWVSKGYSPLQAHYWYDRIGCDPPISCIGPVRLMGGGGGLITGLA